MVDFAGFCRVYIIRMGEGVQNFVVLKQSCQLLLFSARMLHIYPTYSSFLALNIAIVMAFMHCSSS